MHIKANRFGGAVFCILGIIISLAAGLWPSVSAASNNGSVSIVFQIEDRPVSDASWKIYKVGERENDGKFTLYGEFANYPVSLEDTSSSAMQDAADTLENYAVLDNISALSTGITDADGKLTFSHLEEGLYLLAGKSDIHGNIRYIPSPMLIELSEINGNIDSITVYPKMKIVQLPDTEKTKFSVRKTWVYDRQFANKIPDSVTIEVYKDGELFDTCTLNQSNNWSYSWNGMTKSEWRVKEVNVAKDFTVIYRTDAVAFEVENSHHNVGTTDNNEKPNGGSENGGKLPQTGQLWWPVPILAGVGLILIVVGRRLHNGKEGRK